ncbi:MAG: peptidase MA family metallohydrolase [Planctomycetota bacterium]
MRTWIKLLPFLVFFAASVRAAPADPFSDLVRTEQPGWWWLHRADVAPGSPAILSHITSELTRVRRLLGLTATTTPLVVYAATAADFNLYVARMGATPQADWVAAVAFPTRAVMLLKGPALKFGALGFETRTLSHELVHLCLGEAGAALPRWYHEGLAEYLSGEVLDPEWLNAFGAWAARGVLLPLDGLESELNTSHHRAGVYYQQCLAFVRFMSERHGDACHARLLESLRVGQTFDAAFERALGMTPRATEAAWHADLKRNFSWVRAILGYVQLFAIVAVCAAIGFIFVRRRRRATRERMRDPIDGDNYWDVHPPGGSLQ